MKTSEHIAQLTSRRIEKAPFTLFDVTCTSCRWQLRGVATRQEARELHAMHVDELAELEREAQP